MSAYSTAVLADTPFVYWRMDETGATSFVDATGGGRSLNKIGGAYPATTSLIQMDPSNGSALLPHLGTKRDIHTAAAITFQPMTVECWIRYGGAGAPGGMICSSSNGSNGFWCAADSTGGGRLLWQLPGVSGAGIFTGTTIVSNVNYHIVFSYDATNFCTAYLNGVQVGSPINCGAMIASAAVFDVSGWEFGTGQNLTDGTIIDEIAVYNAALSGAQVLTHYKAAVQNTAPVEAIEFSSAVTADTYTFSPAATIPAGTFIFGAVGANNTATIISASDNSTQAGNANVYTIATGTNGTTLRESPFYCLKTTRAILATDVITIQLGTTASRRNGKVYTWPAPTYGYFLDKQSGAANVTASPLVWSSSGALAQTFEIAIACAGYRAGAASGFTAPTGYTSSGTSNGSGGTVTIIESDVFWRNDAGTAAEVPSMPFTNTPASSCVGRLLTFAINVNPPSTGSGSLLLMGVGT